jgi:hypothetical protein
MGKLAPQNGFTADVSDVAKEKIPYISVTQETHRRPIAALSYKGFFVVDS